MGDFFDIDLSELSVFSFIGIAFLGALIYAFLWLFKNYLVLLVIQSPVRRKKVIAKLPVVSTIIWIFFVLYVFYVLITPFPFFGIILSLIFIYLGRGYLINLIHGLFFRLKGDISIGQKIAIDDHSGIVHKMNVFDMEIENKKGEIIQVPYGNMDRKEIVKKDFSVDFSSFTFSILTSSETTEAKLKNTLLQMPWVTTVFQPKVTKTIQTEGQINYDIIVYALDEKFHSHIENDLKRSLLN